MMNWPDEEFEVEVHHDGVYVCIFPAAFGGLVVDGLLQF